MESGLVAAIGRTPLVRLTRIERDVQGLELYGKLEASNPGGSVKDRGARSREAIARRHVGQHGDCLRDARRRAGIPRDAVSAGEREP